MILGCDAAGLDEDGNEVVVHAVISDPSWRGDETFDPKRSLLSERYQGTFADKVAVPRRNVSPSRSRSPSRRRPACRRRGSRPTGCCSPRAGSRPATRVLVQGAGGGVATALITLARAGGLKVLATSRDEAKRKRALEIGAHEVFESGERLPVQGRRRDGDGRPGHLVALDPVAAPGRHDRRLRYDVRPQARRRRAHPHLLPPAQGDRLDHGHPHRARAAWSTCSTPPAPDRSSTATLPMEQASDGFAAMAEGDVFGKIVFTH